jgi:dihydroorotate dehydrogenase electron transfer subunit
MKIKSTYEIGKNESITPHGVLLMKLYGDMSFGPMPGQFINIKLGDFYLRRPFGICDFDFESMTIIYKVVGKGTSALSGMMRGEKLDILCGLGNCFDVEKAAGRVVLIGGGVGLAPLYCLAKELCRESVKFVTVLGFRSVNEMFYVENFTKLCPTCVATADGSFGQKGFVTDILNKKCLGDTIDYDYYYACGPKAMLRAVLKLGIPGQLSLEAHMACGFGACMGCTCITAKSECKRICADVPVFASEEVDFL